MTDERMTRGGMTSQLLLGIEKSMVSGVLNDPKQSVNFPPAAEARRRRR